jgi:hypothetical protein
MKAQKILPVVFALALSSTSAFSLTLEFDFGNAATLPSGNWNILTTSSGPATNAIDFVTGLGTGVSLTPSIPGWSGSTVLGDGFATTGWVASEASGDCFFGYGNGSFVFGGLTPGANYSLEWVASTTDFMTWAGSGYQANGQNASHNQNNTLTDIALWNPKTAQSNKDWMVWDSVTADGTGKITVTVTDGGFGSMSLANAARLTSVPEPSTYVMIGAGALGLLATRRRRA